MFPSHTSQRSIVGRNENVAGTIVSHRGKRKNQHQTLIWSPESLVQSTNLFRPRSQENSNVVTATFRIGFECRHDHVQKRIEVPSRSEEDPRGADTSTLKRGSQDHHVPKRIPIPCREFRSRVENSDPVSRILEEDSAIITKTIQSIHDIAEFNPEPSPTFASLWHFSKMTVWIKTGISQFVRSDHQITVSKFYQNRSARKQIFSAKTDFLTRTPYYFVLRVVTRISPTHRRYDRFSRSKM